MWDHRRMAWAIYWIIIGLFVQAQGFSTTVVEEGEDAIIECGLQTEVEEGNLRWEAITNDTTVVLAYDLRGGFSSCDDRIVNCTIHANGSIQLESVGKEDGATYYRCLRGDEHGFNYYSDHRLLVLSKEKTSSPPSIETPHRESVSSYNMGKKGVLHGYNAPVCEDDVDGNLPVVCYPPSGLIVDREYETIQCNCTDSDGLMDNVTFPATRVTHGLHPGWTAFCILLVISIPIISVLLLICCILHMKLKKFKEKCEHAAADPEEMTFIQSETKDQQNSDLKGEIAELEATLNKSQTELTGREQVMCSLTDQLEQKETQEKEMKNKLEEQNKKINTIQTELTERAIEVCSLTVQLEQKEKQTFKNGRIIPIF